MADHAVVVGIQNYPGIQDLGGPCNDAEEFRRWLLEPGGGGLDAGNVSMLTSGDFPAPSGVHDAHPVLAELEQLFRPLVTRAAQSQHTDGRLFIFAAGHGFADPQNSDSAALFTADAEFLFPTNLALVAYTGFFRRTWAFDEVILILDACRTTNALQQISPPPLPRVTPHPNASRVKTFIAYAAGFNQLARERAFDDGRVRGIFTTALLDALRNARPNSLGRVNGTAVKRHVHNSINRFAGDAAITPPEIMADEHRDVLFVRRQDSAVAIAVQLDAQHLGRELVILFGGLHEVTRLRIDAIAMTVLLDPGLYKARVDGSDTSTIFEVPGDVSVTL
jgi:hypothetical protein